MTFADILETLTDAGTSTGSALKKGAKNLSSYDREDILAAIGLEPKRSTSQVVVPAIGFFAVGILAGVGLGMLFAPKPGYELREDLSEQMKGAVKKGQDMANQSGVDTGSPIV
jgi:hypothetical protein